MVTSQNIIYETTKAEVRYDRKSDAKKLQNNNIGIKYKKNE